MMKLRDYTSPKGRRFKPNYGEGIKIENRSD